MIFVLTEKKYIYLICFYNAEIKNDATQCKIWKHHNLKENGCTKSVTMQVSEKRTYRKEDKPKILKFHLKSCSKKPHQNY